MKFEIDIAYIAHIFTTFSSFFFILNNILNYRAKQWHEDRVITCSILSSPSTFCILLFFAISSSLSVFSLPSSEL